MSGILERIEAKLDQLLAQGAQTVAPTPAPVVAAPVSIPGAGFPTAAAPQPVAAPVAVPAAQYPPATSEQITALITPYVADPNVKAALQAQMQAMGIAALPEAQPHQYGELYARFQAVIGQVQAQQAAAPVAAAAPASII